MNILITGANGFIGKHLTKEFLSRGHNVFAVVTSTEDMQCFRSKNLKCFELFFDDYQRIADLIKENIDIVYHLAWDGLSGPKAKDIDLQLKNVKATAVLLEQIKLLNAKKIVFASTMNALEVRSSLSDPLKYKPRGTYVHVAAKINAEIVARTFCSENNIEYNEGIIAMAYGEGNYSRMVPNIFIYNVLKNIEPKLVTGENQYDLVYVKDIVSAFVAIGEKGINFKSYYIGHNWNKTFKDIFKEVGSILNPNLKINFGAYPEDNAIDFSIIDRGELTKDTGWIPSFDFRQSVLNTADWIKKNIIDANKTF